VKPYLTDVLAAAARDLAGFVPTLEPAYLRGRVGAVANALAVISEDLDRAVPRRVEENRAFRALFRDAAPQVADAALAARLTALAAEDAQDLRLSALDADNDRLRAVLIELHAHVEAREDPAAKALDAAIWRELKASTDRRRLAFANF
jgi:hypothetical protein